MKKLFLLVTYHLLIMTIISAQWLKATIPVGDNPWDLIYNPLNNKVYCANDWSNTVSVLDDTSDSVITTIPVGSSPRAWNPIQNRT